jgi:hypothetical protein
MNQVNSMDVDSSQFVRVLKMVEIPSWKVLSLLYLYNYSSKHTPSVVQRILNHEIWFYSHTHGTNFFRKNTRFHIQDILSLLSIFPLILIINFAKIFNEAIK